MEISNNRVFAAIIATVTLVVTLIFFISLRQSRRLKDTGQLISHTQQVIISIQNVLLAELDHETSFRRYLITGDRQYFNSEKRAEQAGRDNLKIVKALTADNLKQQANCDSLLVYFDKRIAYSRRVAALRDVNGIGGITSTVLTNEGKFYSDRIRELGTTMQNEENALLETRRNANEKSFASLNLILYSMLVLGFVLGIIIIKNFRLKRIKQSLNEEKFKALLEAAPDATVVVNEKGEITLVNQQVVNLFGYSPGEMIGRPVEILIPEELWPKHEGHRADFLKAARVRTMGAGIELSAVKSNGEKVPVEISLSPIKTHEGILISASIRDITLRKKEEEKLKIAKKDFQLLVSSVKDYAIFLLDKAGHVASWNTGAEHIKGYTADEIIGKPLDVFYTDEEKALGEPQRNLQLTLQYGHYETEGLRLRKDGTTFFANVVFTALVDEEGKLYGYAKVTKDISEKRKADERIRFLASIADNIQDPVISTDNDSHITRWNKPAEDLFEWKSEEVIGKTTHEVLKTSYQREAREEILRHLAEKGFWHGEVIYHTKSGKPVNVLATASHLKDDNGDVVGNIILVRDVTDRIKAEVKLREFEHFFNNSNDFSCIANKDGYFEILNPSFEKVLGYSHQELTKNPFLNFVHPEDAAATLQEYGKLKSGAAVLHFVNRYRKKDGDYLWFDWFATPNAVTGKLYCIARDVTDRKKAEDALNKLNEELEQRIEERTRQIFASEKKYRYLFENNPMPLFIMDLKTFKYLDVNGAGLRQYGYNRKEFLSLTALDVRPDEDKKAFLQLDHIYNDNRESYNKGIWNHCKKDGTIIQVEIIAHEIIFEGKEARLIHSNDVTEKIKAEKKLADSEIHFRSLIENSSEGISLLDPDSNVLYRSPSAEKIIGNNPTINSISLAHPGNLKSFENKFAEALSKPGVPIPYEVNYLQASGHYIWAEGTFTNLLQLDAVKAVVANFRDITSRKNAEEKLIESEKLYRSLFTNILNGFAYCKAIIKGDKLIDFTYLAVNEEYEVLTGLKDITGKNMSEVIPGLLESDPGYAELMRSVALSGNSEKFETYVHPLGKWFSVSLYSPEREYFVSLVDNITERKINEQKIKNLNIELEEKVERRTAQLKKSVEEMEAFSYSISHDLRAPLRGIIGFANILEEEYGSKLDDEAMRITTVIKKNTTRMGALIDDLLSFSRTGRQELMKTNVDTNKLVKDVIEDLDPDRNKIEWILHPLPAIKADANTLKQVWINLISNAVKYSGNTNNPRIEIGSIHKNGSVTFFVKDNGVGFDEKYKNKLFKVFQRLHTTEEFEGTGIGLAIVDKIISKHGGGVWVEAELNKGATFYFSLPVEKE